MKWLTNSINPKTMTPRDVFPLSDETREQAYRNKLIWLSDKIIGDPQATDDYSVEELKKMGMVGIYSVDQ